MIARMRIIENTSSFISYSHKSAQEVEVFLHIIVCWGKWRITKYQIERIQIYTDCKISVSLFGSSEMLLSHGKTSFCGGADEFFEYIFPASRCYGGAHLDSGHPPP